KPEEIGRMLDDVRSDNVGIAADRSDQLAEGFAGPHIVDFLDAMDTGDLRVLYAQLVGRKMIENFDLIALRFWQQGVEARPDLQAEANGPEQREQGGLSIHHQPLVFAGRGPVHDLNEYPTT